MHIILYTMEICPQGDEAKALLEERNLPYKEVVITSDESKILENENYICRDDFLLQLPKERSLPKIVIDGAIVGGLHELKDYFYDL